MAPPRPSTIALHADDPVHHATGSPSVGPTISLSTTFRYPYPSENEDHPFREGENLPNGDAADEPGQWDGWDPHEPKGVHIYSRHTQPGRSRVEAVLGQLCEGHAITYGSGLAAAFAALLNIQPDVIAITDGYHGCHETIKIYARTRGNHCDGKPKVSVIKLADEYPKDENTKVMCWLETPLNPTGEILDIQSYADKVHACSPQSVLFVDSTFGPPPLQDPFVHGADIIMHSGSKYFGGHSDALNGVLVVKSKEKWMELWTDRTYSGMTPGSIEVWLLLRSLRTLHLRVPAQSATATSLAFWLQNISQTPQGQTYDGVPGGIVAKVMHGSLQDDGRWVGEGKQMPGGGPACFGFLMAKKEHAKWLPHSVKLFTPATSLGGVESLIEQRLMSDPKCDPTLIRISVGLEDVDDLKEDLRQGFAAVLRRE